MGKLGSILLIVSLAANMVAMGIFGSMYWKQLKEAEAQAEKERLAQVAADEKANAGQKDDNVYTRKMIKFEPLIINLTGDNGRREAHLVIEARGDGEGIFAELNRLKPKIRDIIVATASGETPEEITSTAGKEEFKAKLKEQINAVLSKGQLTDIYITDLELN